MKTAQLKAEFKVLHDVLISNEERIVSELNNVQGHTVDLGGYYKQSETLVKDAMRPSTTFNTILKIRKES